MQLVAYGAQDVYLSGNPQITFFKVVYRRHTNFAVEPIPQTWNGSADFGRTVTCNISRNGDLITNMYLCVELAPTQANNVSWGYVNRLGHALIQDVKIEIGGSKIDEHYADWLNIWYELTHQSAQVRGYAKMIGNDPALTTLTTLPKLGYTMYVPLIFWFNRNNGLALPLIALQYHDVRITLIYNQFQNCINFRGITAPVVQTPMTDSFLVIDYVYLDSEERKRFAQASHEYLIEQLQFTGSESLNSISNKYRLNFNHPCKYLIWAPHFDLYQKPQQWLSYSVNNNWNQSLDEFAKVLSIITASNLKITTQGNNTWIDIMGNSSNSIPPPTEGSLIQLESIGVPVNSLLANLINKIEVQWSINPFSVGNTNGNMINHGHLINGGYRLGRINNENDILALLGNAIVTRNSLLISDISILGNTLTGLIGNTSNSATGGTYDPTTQQTNANALLNIIGYTIVNQFNYGNNIDGSDNPVYDAKLQLNGHDRFQDRDGYYFNYVQPYQHFTHTPADGINVYSFALKAEDHQPTGSCNFSRIDNATLNVSVGYNNSSLNSNTYTNTYLSGSSSVMNIYTVNYNVLRVMSGMAGTAYSN
jgi:hypothetical protein